MKNFTDMELAELADWAEKNAVEAMDPDEKKAYSAMRQGADWMLRFRTKKRQKDLESTGQNNTPTTRFGKTQ